MMDHKVRISDTLATQLMAGYALKAEFDETIDVVKSELDGVLKQLGDAGNDSRLRRAAINEYLFKVGFLLESVCGAQYVGPIKVLVTALEEADRGNVDHLLKPTVEYDGEGNRSQAGAWKPLTERFAIATCKAIAECLSGGGKTVRREADQTVGTALDIPCTKWTEFRRKVGVHEDGRINKEDLDCYSSVKEALLRHAKLSGRPIEAVAAEYLKLAIETGRIPKIAKSHRATSRVKRSKK
ncbi:hypothetical protein KFF05_00415 [bacterium SCSIO 12827]|nr:hypothetical protein KFF05_00415 [bacterium SCSIO 12827]